MSSERVDFFIVGAMKSGTTSLRALLGRSTGINACRNELHYFDNDEIHARGPDWYHAQFAPNAPEVLRGDKSPSYGFSAAAAARIAAYNPDARIIWILRDPVERAVSNFYHAKKRREDAPDLDHAVERRDALERRNATTAYVFRSQYETHLAFYAGFARERTRIVILEEILAGDPEPLRDLFRFLGAPAPETLRFPHSNEGVSELRDRFPVAPATLDRLRRTLAPTVDAIEARLGRKIPAWRPS